MHTVLHYLMLIFSGSILHAQTSVAVQNDLHEERATLFTELNEPATNREECLVYCMNDSAGKVTTVGIVF